MFKIEIPVYTFYCSIIFIFCIEKGEQNSPFLSFYSPIIAFVGHF